MLGEFSAACANYYRLTFRFKKVSNHGFTMVRNVIPYVGQTNTAELDAILESERKAKEATTTANDTELEWQKAKWLVIEMMEYFGITANTKLTVTIPYEVEFELWLDDEKSLHFEKTADLS